MNKPNRHNNHILETESNKFFNFQVPNEWYIDKPEHDYGIDYVVNIVTNNQVTGLSFSVQLKSKIKETKDDFAVVSLKHSTLGLFNTKLEPVLLVAYIQEEKEAYWCWYNELEFDLTSSQKSYSINIPKANKLSQIDWGKISKYVQDIFSVKMLVDGIKSLEYEEISNSQILAWKYYFSQDFEKSSFYFKNLLVENPNDIAILEGLAQSQYNTFHYKEAINNINKAIELSGTSNQYLTKACILAEDGMQNGIKGKIIEAKNIFKEFINQDNTQFIYHYNYANTLSRLGYNEEAITHFELCLKLNPNFEQAWKNLGQVYFDIKEHEKELNCYDKALRINPHLPQALFSKGVTLSRIFNKSEEGLSLMLKAVGNVENILLEYQYTYFGIAYAYEKLGNIKEALNWINKGLEHYSEDIIYLNFKSNLLIENWKDNEWLIDEALRFFEFRLELENDYKSLYSILLIKQLKDEKQIFDLIQKHTSIFKETSFESIKDCEIDLSESIVFLLHYDRYLDFRNSHSIYRYSDHLISELFVVSIEFWEILDFIFAKSFSNAITQYFKSEDSAVITQTILNEFGIAAKVIKMIFPETDFPQEEAIEIMAHICAEFPKIIIREFGAQAGMITGSFGIDKPETETELSEEWFGKLHEQSLIEMNRKLKLLKED
ncbi:tetratricopeptide repeat protein [Aquimarina sp. MAR_2010_214]|uniref:tetratricopeptide repeat protein n=1 Tax=Aquimarina sp. MAR_2010_214 TaxID=1250026 RepID=UPI000C70ADA5|nr:tetratricopeptide repeat protein [Aquimarina sp. MAR_2010_214]PKV52874.1 tetratricopeptide repeat protein [Aquimarina sp. MAR_2010_214]